MPSADQISSFESPPGSISVIKFGGKSLGTPEQLKAAAILVKKKAREGGVVVVVSAMGDDTTSLLDDLYRAVSYMPNVAPSSPDGAGAAEPDYREAARFAGLGEIKSAYLFSAALNSLGEHAVAITPESRFWPIHADETNPRALTRDKVNERREIVFNNSLMRRRINSHIRPLVETRIIPVICGFLTLDSRGLIGTLGRGGSDTTAFLLGKFLKAREVLIVTDVPGILRADPRILPSRIPVERLSIRELEDLASTEMRALHPDTLRFKTSKMDARVLGAEELVKENGGTRITGSRRIKLASPLTKLAMVTVVGEKMLGEAGLLADLSQVMNSAGITIYGVTVSDSALGLYVPQKNLNEALRLIAEKMEGRSCCRVMGQLRELARLTIASADFIDTPGIVARVGRALARGGVKIVGMVTQQSELTLFVKYDSRKPAKDALWRFAAEFEKEISLKAKGGSPED